MLTDCSLTITGIQHAVLCRQFLNIHPVPGVFITFTSDKHNVFTFLTQKLKIFKILEI